MFEQAASAGLWLTRFIGLPTVPGQIEKVRPRLLHTA